MDRAHVKKRYRIKDGRVSIDLKLKTPHQLFDERDPAPFRDRDLDDDAARYIVGSLKELPEPDRAKLSLYFASLSTFESSPHIIKNAIHAYFRYEADLKRRELRDTFKIGFISLGIGLTFLFACTYFSHGMYSEDSDLFLSLVREGLFVMGWVAMWKPVSTFLYEWWPIRSSLKLLRTLSQIEIEILPLVEAVVPNEVRETAVEASPSGGLHVHSVKM